MGRSLLPYLLVLLVHWHWAPYWLQNSPRRYYVLLVSPCNVQNLYIACTLVLAHTTSSNRTTSLKYVQYWFFPMWSTRLSSNSRHTTGDAPPRPLPLLVFPTIPDKSASGIYIYCCSILPVNTQAYHISFIPKCIVFV